MHSSWTKDFFILGVALGTLLFFMLGLRPLSTPDEGRYAEIPREMVASGDYITPRLNGIKYFEKPPLFYWLQASAIKIGGLNEWSLRLWTALLALFGCLITYATGRIYYDRKTGIFAAVILATSVLYYTLSRLTILDLPVGVFMCAGLFSFMVQYKIPARRQLFKNLAFAMIGLAVMTKGLMGFLLPGFILFLWMICTQQFILLKDLFAPTGWLIFLSIVAPWHILASMRNPEFAEFYFIHEHFTRFLTKTHGRYQPVWFFIPVLLVGFFPWISFMVEKWKNDYHYWRNTKNLPAIEKLWLLWTMVIFCAFSCSSSKLIPYIIPIFPVLALQTASIVVRYYDHRSPTLSQRPFHIFASICGLIVITLISLYHIELHEDYAHLKSHLFFAGTVLLAGALITSVLSHRHHYRRALISMGGTTLCLLLSLNYFAKDFQRPSMKEIASHLKPILKPEDLVFTYHTYYQDLPVYLDQLVHIVDWKGELMFGSKIEDMTHRLTSTEYFWSLWQGRRRIYVVMPKRIFNDVKNRAGFSYLLIAESARDIVLSNL